MPPTKEQPKLLTAPKPYDFGFTLGADPEFTMMSGTRPMNTRSTMKAFIKDAREVPDSHGGGFIFEPFGNIGWDGHPATGELRPMHADRPEGVTANIRGLFEAVAERIPFVEFATLTVAHPTGGHIHLSIPEDLGDIAVNKTPRWHAIERAMATFLLLILMSENALSRELRRRSNGGRYGDLLDFRVDQKFTYPSGAPGYTLEVRGPTAEWLTTEKLTLGTMAYLAIAWDSIIKGNLAPIKEVLLENKRQVDAVLPTLLSNFGGAQKLYLNKMRPFIRKHPAYREYKNELELIINPQKAVAAKRAAHFSITEGWGIGKKTAQISRKAFLDEDAIEDKTADFPESVIRNVSAFAWNDDANVEAFATALSKRCIALGWKPEHEYFLFGLKKGLDTLVMRDEKGNFLTGHEMFETKEDLKIMRNKFNRLAPKAIPAYGNFLNHRTGEPTSEDSSMRVMIGVPWAMRQKADYKKIIDLVLKFEKSPKAFSAVEEASLPDGAGKIKGALEKQERLERQLLEAEASGDEPLQLLPEDVQAFHDSRETVAMTAAPLEATPTARTLMQDDTYRLAELQLIVLRSEIAPGTAATELTRRMAMGDLPIAEVPDVVRWLDEGTDVGQALRSMRGSSIAWLVLAISGQRGTASVARTNWTHGIVPQDDVYLLSTSSVGQTAGASIASVAVLADLLGIDEQSTARLEAVLLQDNRLSITKTSGGNGTFRYERGAIVVSPDTRRPHLWSSYSPNTN